MSTTVDGFEKPGERSERLQEIDKKRQEEADKKRQQEKAEKKHQEREKSNAERRSKRAKAMKQRISSKVASKSSIVDRER